MLRMALVFVFLLTVGFYSVSGQSYPSFKITSYDTASKGYYFLAPIRTDLQFAGNATFFILDKKGRVVYYKNLPRKFSAFDFKVQSNGLISFSYNQNIFYLEDSTFKIVDSVYCKNGYATDSHDMQILPNGHFLLIGSENITMDLSGYPYFKNNGSPGSKNALITCGVVQELDENKNVVFEWHVKDHCAFNNIDPYYLNNPTNVDWSHLNAVSQDTDGNILLSSRHFNQVMKINRKDGSIIWRLGGKGNMFNFTNDSQMFLGQHDIRRIENGNLTIFDNGRASGPFHAASGKEYIIDETNFKAILTWKHTERPDAYSLGIGNMQRLKDEASLINYGLYSSGNLVFNVVNKDGNKIFELAFEDSFRSYRAFNYPDLPWWLHRPKLTCSSSAGKVYLQTAKAYPKYNWNNGDTTQAIEAKTGDTVSVFVPDGYGGFISSVPIIVSDHTDPCGLTAITEKITTTGFSMYPNPATDEIMIKFQSFGYEEKLADIFDITGKRVESAALKYFNHTTVIDISALPKGIYILSAGNYKMKFIKD